MRKWRLPLTYQPKIEPVRKGECRQTIRIRNVNKKTGKMAPAKRVGDLIQFFLWSGRPYWSKQIDLTEYEPLIHAIRIRITPEGITRFWPEGTRLDREQPDGCFMPWSKCGCLAERDSIVPPTGEALRDVLIGKNGKIRAEGIEAQILRW
jgi:hypothetical protein